MKHLSPLQIHQTAAEILAAAVLELCPDAHIIEGRGSHSGFAYDFLFLSPFSDEMLPFVEERMQKIIGENLSIEHREMVPDNAAEFFRQYPRYYPSIFAKQEIGPLVDVFQMRGFTDLCPGPYANSTGEVGRVKLLRVTERPPMHYRRKEHPVTRIEGIVSADRKGLKELLKKRSAFFKTEHRRLGKTLSLFMIEKKRGKHCREMHRCFWLSEGERVREMLLIFWREIYEREEFEIIQTQGSDLLKNHTAFFELTGELSNGKVRKIAECSRAISEEGIDPWQGLFESKDYLFDRAHLFCSEDSLENVLISSLQLLEKISNMLGFEKALEISAPKRDRELYFFLKKACKTAMLQCEEGKGGLARVVWKIVDRYGMRRDGPFMELCRGKNGFVVTSSLFNRMERFIALLMEAEGPSFEKRMKNIAKKRNFE